MIKYLTFSIETIELLQKTRVHLSSMICYFTQGQYFSGIEIKNGKIVYMSDTFKVVIPARYASSRFPGKPLGVDQGYHPFLQSVLPCQSRHHEAVTTVVARAADHADAPGTRPVEP